jgi:hypothetical protein
MSAILLAVVLVGQSSFQDSSSIVRSRPASPAKPATDRGFLDYQRELSGLFRGEAAAKDNAAKAKAIRNLCALHARIVSDSRYATSDTLKEYRARIWSRLTKVKADLKREFGRDAAAQAALEESAALEAADAASAAAADSLAASLSLAGQTQGGPGYLLSGGAGSNGGSTGAFGGGAGTGDYGPELVALIERTINPAFWDVVGGPGTIVYFQPLQCLVVRATSEVHGNLGGLLGGLRAAGP